MCRSLLVAALAVALSGCTFPQHTHVGSTDQSALVIVSLGEGLRYYIDPRTETCLLVSPEVHGQVVAPVSCAKLKASVPEAARVITWVPSPPEPMKP